jgi:hypothetical protein
MPPPVCNFSPVTATSAGGNRPAAGARQVTGHWAVVSRSATARCGSGEAVTLATRRGFQQRLTPVKGRANRYEAREKLEPVHERAAYFAALKGAVKPVHRVAGVEAPRLVDVSDGRSESGLMPEGR